MRTSIKLAVIAALFVGTFAINNSIKKKLIESANKNLVEVDSEVQQMCDCSMPTLSAPSLSFCPGSAGAPPPVGQGAGSSTVFQ